MGVLGKDAVPSTEKDSSPDIKVAKSATKEEIELISSLTEADIFSDAVVARPLGFGNSLQIKIKRAEYSYRWFNRYAANGSRYTFAKSSGFVNATAEDVEVDNEDFIKDGVIVVGDLILMKMPKLQYLGHIKANALKAEALINPKKLSESQKAEVAKSIDSRVGQDKSGKPKVSVYIPSFAE